MKTYVAHEMTTLFDAPTRHGMPDTSFKADDDRIYQHDSIRFTMSPSGARTRRAELVAQGKVVDSLKRTKLPSGRFAIVWKLA